MTDTKTLTQVAADNKRSVGMFGGKYSATMTTLFKDSQAFLACSNEQADRLSVSFAADWGKFEKQFTVEDTKLKLSKLSKNGNRNLTQTDVSKAKDVIDTPALSIAYIVMELDKLRKQGVLYQQLSGITLIPRLHNWLFQLTESDAEYMKE